MAELALEDGAGVADDDRGEAGGGGASEELTGRDPGVAEVFGKGDEDGSVVAEAELETLGELPPLSVPVAWRFGDGLPVAFSPDVVNESEELFSDRLERAVFKPEVWEGPGLLIG